MTTRAFELTRKLSKGEGLSPEEIHELVEIQKEMPAASFTSELKLINQTLESKLDALNASLVARMDGLNTSLDARLDAQNSSLDARLDAHNSEIRVLRWVIVIGVAIIAAAGFFG
ncbi:MAG: hypothetical protein OXG94_00570 [Bacteroidetes bacterium]|nr:hypothetical protein [Bacteroidota bacterium]